MAWLRGMGLPRGPGLPGRGALKWLYLGLGVKRWLVLLFVGITLLSLGTAFLLIDLYRELSFPSFIYYVTLQFIPPAQRLALIQRIHAGLRPDGILILSEKIAFRKPSRQDFHEELHHDFKRANGYSDLEISQKRSALEKVLIPETLACHQKRLRAAGFSSSELWFQCFNFVSLVAFK